MRTRHASLLALLLGVLGVALLVSVFSGRGQGGTPVDAPGTAAGPVDGPIVPAEPRTAEIDRPADLRPRIAGDPDDPRGDAPVGPPPTEGFLDVRILPTANIVGKFSSGTLIIQELINANATDSATGRKPWTRAVPFDATPLESPIYEAVGGVPFSEYGYRVTVFVAGFNGSAQVIRVDADSWNPIVELTVTAPSPLCVRVVDQQLNPYTEEEIMLVPAADSRGLPALTQTTDGYGSVVFESVLAGDYEVRMGHRTVHTLTVQRPGFVRDDLNVRYPSAQVVVPRGLELKIEVFDTVGWAIEGVQVRAIAVDTVQNRRGEGETDRNGVCTLEHLLPGRYAVDVILRGFQQTSRTITLTEGQVPEPLRFRMARL